MAKSVSTDVKTQDFISGMMSGLKRADGWSNIISGLNGTKDARTYAEVIWKLMAEVDCENIYGGDSMAAKVVDILPDEALNKGYRIIGLEQNDLDKVAAKARLIKFDHVMNMAWKQARLYGGCGILKSYDDDLRLETPAKPGLEIKGLIPFHRFMLQGLFQDLNTDILSPGFNYPLLYTFMPRNAAADVGMAMIKIHYSRITRFDGLWLPDRLRQSNGYWGDTVLGRIYDAVRNYTHAHDSANATLKDMSVAVFKIKNLADQIAAGGEANVVLRVELVNLCKSIARAVVIDADGEDFDYKTRSLGGVKDLLDAAEDRLTAETNIPKTVLLGQSPKGGGLGQSGDHQSENWYSYIQSQQQNYLKPKMMEILKEICVNMDIDPDPLNIEFDPLWTDSADSQASTRMKVAQTDAIYQGMGAVDPSEIRQSRFGGDKYNIDTQIDESLDESLAYDPDAKPPGEADGDDAKEENIQIKALNGPQIASMMEIVTAVASKEIPRQSGVNILMRAFQLSTEEANEILADAGQGFEPTQPPVPQNLPPNSGKPTPPLAGTHPPIPPKASGEQ